MLNNRNAYTLYLCMYVCMYVCMYSPLWSVSANLTSWWIPSLLASLYMHAFMHVCISVRTNTEYINNSINVCMYLQVRLCKADILRIDSGLCSLLSISSLLWAKQICMYVAFRWRVYVYIYVCMYVCRRIFVPREVCYTGTVFITAIFSYDGHGGYAIRMLWGQMRRHFSRHSPTTIVAKHVRR